MIAGMGAGQQMFVAILDPAHRMVELQGERGQDDLFRIEPRLGSEAAADIGCHDADATLLDPENFSERDAHGVRRLGRGVDHDFVEPVVAIREHAAALHRCAGLPVHAVFAAHGDLGVARGGFDVAARDRPLLEQVVTEVFVHQRGAAGARGLCIHHRVERPVVDGDGGGDVLGFGAGRCDAGGDRLADVAHLVGRERRPGR